MELLKPINAVVSFAVELVMLGLLAFGGYSSFKGEQIGRWLAAVLLPLVVIIIWGYFLAPNNSHRVTQPWLCITQLILFSIAVAVSYRFTNHTVLIVFAVLAFSSSLFALFAKQ